MCSVSKSSAILVCVFSLIPSPFSMIGKRGGSGEYIPAGAMLMGVYQSLNKMSKSARGVSSCQASPCLYSACRILSHVRKNTAHCLQWRRFVVGWPLYFQLFYYNLVKNLYYLSALTFILRNVSKHVPSG